MLRQVLPSTSSRALPGLAGQHDPPIHLADELEAADYSGALTALTIGPAPLWGREALEALHSGSPAVASETASVDSVAAIEKVQRHIVAAARRAEIVCHLPTDSPARMVEVATAWCKGFLAEIVCDRDAWAPLHHDKEACLLLAPIFILGAGEKHVGQLLKEVPVPLLQQPLAIVAAVPESVQKIERYWRRRRGDRTPIASDQSTGGKPGRNERCACGSGLKYKRCCGMRS